MEAGVHELTAAYALDALDPDERRAYEEHLAGCERCRAELASLRPATEALAFAASGPEPRGELRELILEAARAATPQVVVPLEPRRSRVVPVLASATALAAAVALAVGVWAAQVSSDLDDTRSALERERAAAAVLAGESTSTVALQAGSGRLLVARDGRAVLVLDGLRRAPAGKTYQLWIVPGGAIEDARPAGFLESDAAERALALLDGLVTAGDVVAVTIEDAGGADAPTSDPVAASSPV